MDDKTPDADRLGFLYGLPGVDAENVALFAKITRILGLLIVVSFVLWGMFYEWAYSRGPFEQFMREIGVRGSDFRYLSAWAFSALITVAGFRYRFQIGILFIGIFFRIYSVIAALFRKI